jgi:ESCRT-II complex subunit VPS22
MRPKSLAEKRRDEARILGVGKAIAADHAKHVETQLAVFKERLVQFSTKYRHEINRDPVFRNEFAKMTKAVGVDPLASNKGFWGELLGLGEGAV